MSNPSSNNLTQGPLEGATAFELRCAQAEIERLIAAIWQLKGTTKQYTGEPCAQMAVRAHEKTIALVKEIHDRHGRVNKLLYGPGSVRNAMLGPMDSDAAHRDRGALLSMLTPAQRGTQETNEHSPKGLASAGSSAAVNPRDTVGGSAEPSGRPAAHSVEDDFQHWLSYSGNREASPSMQALFRAAYYAGTDRPPVPKASASPQPCIWRTGCKHPQVCEKELRCVPGGIEGQS